MDSLSIARIVDSLFSFYSTLIFVYVILSWFRGEGFLYEAYRVLGSICEPYIGLFRRVMPTLGVGGAGIDFSPLVALLVLQLLRRLVVGML